MSNAFLEHRAKYREVVSRRYGVTPELYDEASRLLAPLTSAFSLRKGEYLQRIGTPAQYVHWLHSGVARTGFITEAGNEVTLHFQTDGDAVGAHDDLLRAREAEPALNFVVAETAIHGFRLDWMEVLNLYRGNTNLRDYYLGAAQRSIMDQSRRLYLNASPAQGRLIAFRREYPGLEQRISQKVVASFLGITPQYMSQLLRQDGSKA
ncbi:MULTISPECIES: Crp/Fnr family transcriptional regulator [unclassified Duganella]|jgi:CRP-like cAMP-binding protein|uniref:Crp/Fnr family transcriptional regulator n=1 Tax=unclassified Duganella TaxID=2636909 RepID=UPI00088704AC|nr:MULTISPECIES: Crp/Fnr family transcriptional regulator [unclassified Duganella]SDH59186.1 cAMP-binding domain of CRP or a regulatory subunit of cAMP-dependent protein kinases [Duganella sp. OV458]SDJ44062.1 cAMP-binding domain of CRP or a regulatory subunit of cAMP-dependent protein kinases [Duganella sp. OV510]